MPAVIAEPTASRAPRTSSSMQLRASTTLTFAPSHSPSARSRQASASPQRIESTVARDPVAHEARRQDPFTAGSTGRADRCVAAALAALRLNDLRSAEKLNTRAGGRLRIVLKKGRL